jgi:hypothetical protein
MSPSRIDPGYPVKHFSGSQGVAVHQDLFGEEASSEAPSMTKNHWKRMLGRPVVIAIAVAVFGVLAMLVVDHGPWTRPKLQTAEVASHKTTSEAARAVGAEVTPTAPKSELEPIVPGPKPVEPANPLPR